MSFYRLLLQRSLQSFSHSHTTPQSPLLFLSTRSFAFSSAEEAAAERRRRRRNRLFLMERPLHALRRDPGPQPLPDTLSALVGPRLILHCQVQSLIHAGDLDSASATACQAVFSNTRPTVFTCNAVMASMLRARRLEDVVALFRFFFQQSNIVPDIVSYNVLINTHCDAGRVDAGLEVYQHILAHTPFRPTDVTINHIIKGLIDSNRISEAENVLREMNRRGRGLRYLFYKTLIDGFIKLGNMEKALGLFDEIRGGCIVSDGVLLATFMDAYFKKGMENEAMELYSGLLHGGFKTKPVPLTYNILLEVLLRYGKMNHALALFDHMLTAHTPPHFPAMNTDSYNLVVNEFCRLRKFDKAVAVFKKTGKKPCVMDVGCYNNIIGKLCAENGWVSEAENLFDEMPGKSVEPNVSTYGFLIDVYLRDGRMDDVLRLFGKMLGEAGLIRLELDVTFYNKVFDGLVGKGRTEEAMEIYRTMAERKLKPDLRSYEILITGLCREGGLDQSLHLLEEMVNNRVVLSPTICEVAFDAFGKACRSIEVERLLQDKTETIADPQAVASRV